MSKFNFLKSKKKVTTNFMGAKAYQYDERFELVATLLTTFVEDAYYKKSKDTVARLVELSKQIDDKVFLAKAVIYARTVFNMRSISHVMAAELASDFSGKEFASQFYDKIVVRPDDMLEIMAYQFSKKEKAKLSNSMRKGFKSAMEKMDAYQLAKYRGENKVVKMVDMINLLHPKPNSRNEVAFQQLTKGTLRNTNTWESKLTAAGQKAGTQEEKQARKKASWEDLILSRKLGYMALLRNLRNILQADISDQALQQALAFLSNPKAVENSKQFPFRFLSAYQEITELEKGKSEKLLFEKDGISKSRIDLVKTAIEKAINSAIANLPLLEGKTVILSDNSGSMRGDYGGSSAISAMSKRTTSDIANLFATLYWMRCDNTLVGLFGDRLLMPQMDRKLSLFNNFELLHKRGADCGGGTETGIFTMFEKLIEEKLIVARIVIFSDMQIGKGCTWYDNKQRKGADFNALYERYLKINPDVKVYSVDLRGYGTTVFKGNVYKIAGWSEKIFNIMETLEQKPNALIAEIEQVEL